MNAKATLAEAEEPVNRSVTEGQKRAFGKTLVVWRSASHGWSYMPSVVGQKPIRLGSLRRATQAHRIRGGSDADWHDQRRVWIRHHLRLQKLDETTKTIAQLNDVGAWKSLRMQE